MTIKITFDHTGLDETIKVLDEIGKTARKFLDEAEEAPEINMSYVRDLLNRLSRQYNDAGFAPTSRKIDEAIALLMLIQNLPKGLS